MTKHLLQVRISTGDIQRIAIIRQRHQIRQRRLPGITVIIQADTHLFLPPTHPYHRLEINHIHGSIRIKFPYFPVNGTPLRRNPQ